MSQKKVSSRWPLGIVLVLFALGIMIALSGCAGNSGRVKLKELKLAPLADMPDYVQDSAPEIQKAYRFAVANPELLEYIPCYCGCNSLGHMNNLECYVSPTSGEVTQFDNHASFCGVCIDITLDVMQMSREGKELAEIRAFIDNKYSKSGPSTETDPVPAGLSNSVGPTLETHPEQSSESESTSCGTVEVVSSCSSD